MLPRKLASLHDALVVEFHRVVVEFDRVRTATWPAAEILVPGQSAAPNLLNLAPLERTRYQRAADPGSVRQID